MQRMNQAARAYAATAEYGSVRQQEADVFRRANAALRQCDDAPSVRKVRALADNDRLWRMVIDLMRDPANALPAPLRASIVSLGMTVQREMAHDRPDLQFLIMVNDNMAAGLSAQG